MYKLRNEVGLFKTTIFVTGAVGYRFDSNSRIHEKNTVI